MGLFNKIRNMFKKEVEETDTVLKVEDSENNSADASINTSNNDIKKDDTNKSSVKVYEKGLTKSRQGFVSKLASLTSKYSKVNEEYFEELEEILIMADIGVNTVMNFMDRIRDRVRHENLTDPEELKEIIVDE